MPRDSRPEFEEPDFSRSDDAVTSHVPLDEFPDHAIHIPKKRNFNIAVYVAQTSVKAVENSTLEINPFDKYLSQLILNTPKQIQDPMSRRYSFKYVEGISDFVKLMGSIKAEADIIDESLSEKIYQDVATNTEKYFDIEIAISVIQHHGMMHKNKAVIKSLDALELICGCKSLKGTIRYVYQISEIIETYELRNSWRKDERYDASEVSGKISSLKTKVETILTNYKKETKKLLEQGNLAGIK